MYMCARGIKPGQCERSCICALGVSNLSFSTIFLLDFVFHFSTVSGLLC
jgi:hypothetical protein